MGHGASENVVSHGVSQSVVSHGASENAVTQIKMCGASTGKVF